MANRCSETIELYGSPSSVTEVIEFIKAHKVEQWDENTFNSTVFPHSSCGVFDDKIILETNWGPDRESLKTLSKEFPSVGFKSGSFTDGNGDEELAYVINGNIIFVLYINVTGPEYWLEQTAVKMDVLIQGKKGLKNIHDYYFPSDEFLHNINFT